MLDFTDYGQIVAEVLAEHDVDAEQALGALMAVLITRHVDVELRRQGRRAPYSIGNERADALKAVNDAVHQALAKITGHLGGGPEGAGGERGAVLKAVVAVLIRSQLDAERAVGLGGDDDDDDAGPRLRLVRE